MREWDKPRTTSEIVKTLGPELTEKLRADAKEGIKLTKELARFEDTERRAVVRILYGPCPIMDTQEENRVSPASQIRTYTIFWLGRADSPSPPDDHPYVLAKALDEKAGFKMMSWLMGDRQMVLDLVKAIWNVEVALPEQVIN